MARKKAEEQGIAVQGLAPPTASGGDAVPPPPEMPSDKPRPTFRVGPIATDRNNAVAAALWANEIVANGETFTVYNVTIEARYRDSATGEWKSGKQFRSSQLPTLIYCLQRAFEFGCSQRDPANQCPF